MRELTTTRNRTDPAGSQARARRKVWIVLPAFNEEKDLPSLLDRVEEAMVDAGIDFEVLIVDDGSTDTTSDLATTFARRLPVRLMRHEINEGLGATLRDGLRWGCELAHPKDFIVTLDADNSHTPELIRRMVRMIREGHDVVIASRYTRGAQIRGVNVLRRMLSRIGAVLFKVVFPIPGVRDYTCGYRAYRAELLQRVIQADPDFFDQDGFQVMVDILLKLRKAPGLVFGEAPLILRYDLKEGASKMNVPATIKATLNLMMRRRFLG